MNPPLIQLTVLCSAKRACEHGFVPLANKTLECPNEEPCNNIDRPIVRNTAKHIVDLKPSTEALEESTGLFDTVTDILEGEKLLKDDAEQTTLLLKRGSLRRGCTCRTSTPSKTIRNSGIVVTQVVYEETKGIVVFTFPTGENDGLRCLLSQDRNGLCWLEFGRASLVFRKDFNAKFWVAIC
ncbi:hypothetical protein HG531_009659 [Fusarium graminearum]|nr:hypothetical protein HG531_009659 [Fusarium graminearum]